jgi:hypothetical protein
MRISCGDCAMQGTDQCRDCVVTFILDRDEEDAVVVDGDEARALRVLGEAGLIPTLGFVPKRPEPDQEAGQETG